MRENLRQMALVSARLENRDLGSAVDEIKSMLAAMPLPVGYTWEVGGQYESQQRSFQRAAAGLGHRDGARAPRAGRAVSRASARRVIILAAAPLSLGGAFALLWLTGTDLNVSSAMGLILLVGLVVKNGIVLLDFAELRHREGHADARRDPRGRARAPAADSDDHALHAVRVAAAGAGRWVLAPSCRSRWRWP